METVTSSSKCEDGLFVRTGDKEGVCLCDLKSAYNATEGGCVEGLFMDVGLAAMNYKNAFGCEDGYTEEGLDTVFPTLDDDIASKLKWRGIRGACVPETCPSGSTANAQKICVVGDQPLGYLLNKQGYWMMIGLCVFLCICCCSLCMMGVMGVASK